MSRKLARLSRAIAARVVMGLPDRSESLNQSRRILIPPSLKRYSLERLTRLKEDLDRLWDNHDAGPEEATLYRKTCSDVYATLLC